MSLKKWSLFFSLAAILAACYSETEFNPQDFAEQDEIGEDSSTSFFERISSSRNCSSSMRSESSSSSEMVNVDSLLRYVDSLLAAANISSSAMSVMSSSIWFYSSSSMASSSSMIMPALSSSSATAVDSSDFCSTHGLLGFCWNGPTDRHYRVETKHDNGTDTYGYWYEFNDSLDGGGSYIKWPVKLGNEYSDDAFDPVIEFCGGMCGDFFLVSDSLVYDPFVGIAFNVYGSWTTTSIEPEPLDVTEWGGLCVSYEADSSIVLDLDLGEEKSKSITYDYPHIVLKKSVDGTQVCKTWSEFQQAGWGLGKISGEDAAKTLGALRFKIQAKDGARGHFNIKAVSSYY